ncbi:MAG: peptidoglycan bridge formation glycyltransferase FemA/FemB family protein, partial [Candidatus Taylorbacteria bacterium]
MSYSFRELAPNEAFDPNILQSGTPFTQQSFYGTWQHNLKREVKRYVALKDTQIVAYFQLIVYPLIKGKQYIYIPYGPVCTDSSPECIQALKDELATIAKKNNAVFVRLDFSPVLPAEILKKNFTSAPQSTYHSAYFQPRYEWFLSLNDSEDEILKKMHEKTRYSVRLAERKGIVCEIVTSDFEKYFETFYTLMAGTAERNGFSLHDKAYYQTIFVDLKSIAGSYLSVASFEGKILAIDLVIVSGGVA